MIGPKQFDIRHKTKPRREFDNPIVNKLLASQFRYTEDDIDDLVDTFGDNLKDAVESFLDKFKAPMFEHKEDDEGPENKSRAKKNKISDDMINKITYKVFQNIKSYLDDGEKGDKKSSIGSKGIKIEIDL